MNFIKKEINKSKRYKWFVKDLYLLPKYQGKLNYLYKEKIYGKKLF